MSTFRFLSTGLTTLDMTRSKLCSRFQRQHKSCHLFEVFCHDVDGELIEDDRNHRTRIFGSSGTA